jgi:hypothetical protein
MTPAQYKMPISKHEADRFGESRETHPAVAMAIHAIADSKRSPEAIWTDPTPAEWDHVKMAVESYISAGEFDPTDDGVYQWGEETIRL